MPTSVSIPKIRRAGSSSLTCKSRLSRLNDIGWGQAVERSSRTFSVKDRDLEVRDVNFALRFLGALKHANTDFECLAQVEAGRPLFFKFARYVISSATDNNPAVFFNDRAVIVDSVDLVIATTRADFGNDDLNLERFCLGCEGRAQGLGIGVGQCSGCYI